MARSKMLYIPDGCENDLDELVEEAEKRDIGLGATIIEIYREWRGLKDDNA
jgi:hypothetical protein